jgi:hypothetical protein
LFFNFQGVKNHFFTLLQHSGNRVLQVAEYQYFPFSHFFTPLIVYFENQKTEKTLTRAIFILFRKSGNNNKNALGVSSDFSGTGTLFAIVLLLICDTIQQVRFFVKW